MADAAALVEGIRARWDAGLEDARKAIAHAPWSGEFDPLEGVFLHQPPWEDNMTVNPADLARLTRTDGPRVERVN